MSSQEISIAASDGEKFGAYLAIPDSGTGPGIVVLQEIFGINHVMRDLVDGLAAQSYLAVCPDLFWRQEPSVQLTDKTEADWQRAFELYQGFDVDAGMRDAISTLEHLRGLDGCTGKVGAVGYCLGGKLAYLMATRSNADCAVGYYGVGIDDDLGEAGKIKAPLLLHIAEKDQFVSPEAQAKVKDSLGPNPLVSIESYPGADHAFARIGGEHFDAAAADLANQRTADFFKQNLS